KHGRPPGQLRPSIRGLFDLHGNLLEWTHDWNGAFGQGAAVDPLGPKEGAARVYRGGSWDFDSAYCRVAYRYAVDPTYRANYYGFRLALSLSEVTSSATSVK